MKNRIIKFRIWDIIDKKFSQLIQLPPPEEHVIGFYGFQHYPNRYIYQQFTGLKDKNGKEIFEGDIITFERPEFKEIHQTKKIFIGYIEYVGAEFRIRDEKNNTFHVLTDWCGRNIYSVIGNIFENKDLLNE